LRKVAKRQTDRQTDKQRRLYNLLDGGNQLFTFLGYPPFRNFTKIYP